jgi:hypothetical protein
MPERKDYAMSKTHRRAQRPSPARIAAEASFARPQEATELDAEALEAADLFSRLSSHQRRSILAALRAFETTGRGAGYLPTDQARATENKDRCCKTSNR